MSHSGKTRYAHSRYVSPSPLSSPYPHGRSVSRSLSRSRSRSSRSRDSIDAENPGNNLYVTGLSSRITERELEKHFETEGKVVDAHLVVDRWTKESRGFGFVTMSTIKEADRCIKYLDRSVLEGRVITVEKAKRRRGRTPTPGRYLGLHTRGGRLILLTTGGIDQGQGLPMIHQGEDDHTLETSVTTLQRDLFRLTIVGVMAGDMPHGAFLLGDTGEAIPEATHQGPKEIEETTLVATRQGIEDLGGAIHVATHRVYEDIGVGVHLIVGRQGRSSYALEKATLTAVATVVASTHAENLVIGNCFMELFNFV
ncbi:nucleolin 2-like isoform X5 [Zingiber officinale]|uniref:nucleolin 2-like isoform X5 n=1 Tax=Zingiber officinale TaxID=94328 RepID=UPI001C4B3CAD|nr:nucleolin 2-like isoform X5 [Zingiber officinale]